MRVEPSRTTKLGAATIRRALPRREQRTVGAWCFADHIGPETVAAGAGMSGPGGIGSHPHIGLQTVTWLESGSLLHRDSLGSEQAIQPGQLNLMTAGRGIAHAEESLTPEGGLVHGIQLWVALPEGTREGPAAFEHHGELPRIELDHGTGTVLVGELLSARSPARADTDHFGVELRLRPGTTTLPLHPTHEHALIVLSGALTVDEQHLEPGVVGLVDPGYDELVIRTEQPSLVMLLGGTPFGPKLHMWWNFVGFDRSEIDRAYDDWRDHSDRFGPTGSELPRIAIGPPPWRSRDDSGRTR